jgi:hypothetical protein
VRFAVLTHDWPVAHLDLFLEQNGVLRAWRLPADYQPREVCEALERHDHRLAYLDYVGPVSGDRGTVSRWDAGELEWLSETEQRIEVRLRGSRLNGDFALVLMEGSNCCFVPM